MSDYTLHYDFFDHILCTSNMYGNKIAHIDLTARPMKKRPQNPSLRNLSSSSYKMQRRETTPSPPQRRHR